MEPGQLRERCNGAIFVATARLSAHQLCFPRKSKTRNCGAASVRKSCADSDVWGALFELNEQQWASLDRREGYRSDRPRDQNSYNQIDCVIDRDGDPTQQLSVTTYVAVEQPNPPLPSEEYVALIVCGAKHWGLPEKYVALLEQIPCAVVPA